MVVIFREEKACEQTGKGKKCMKAVGKVDGSQEAFMVLLKLDKTK
jgi:translation elongation factor EF-4